MPRVEVKKIHSLTGHTDCVYTLEPGLQAETFYSAGGDGQIVEWDLRAPELGNLVARLPNSIYALHAFGRDRLAVGHNYEGVHLLDVVSRVELASLQLGNAAIFDIKSHGEDLIVALGDGTVVAIHIPSWSVRRRERHTDRSARAIAVHPGRHELAVAYSDHWIRILDATSLEIKYQWHAHTNSVFTVVYTPDYSKLLSGSRDAHLKAWDPAGGYALAQTVVAHLYAINHIVFSPDSKHFVTCSLDKSIKVWDTDTLTLLKVIDKSRHAGHGTSVNKLLWSSFNNWLASASDDRTISVWDLIFSRA